MYEHFFSNVVPFGRLNLQSMNAFDLAIRETDIAAILRASLIFVAMLSATLFVGCQTSKSKSQASDDTVIREPDKGQEVHGEVGAMYGSSSLSRH
jgi:hypothetical protein